MSGFANGALSNYYNKQRGQDYSRESRSAQMQRDARIIPKKPALDVKEVYKKKSSLKSKLSGASALLDAADGGSGNPAGDGLKAGLNAGLATGDPYVAAAAMGLGFISSSAKRDAERKNAEERFRVEAESGALNRTQDALAKLASMRLAI